MTAAASAQEPTNATKSICALASSKCFALISYMWSGLFFGWFVLRVRDDQADRLFHVRGLEFDLSPTDAVHMDRGRKHFARDRARFAGRAGVRVDEGRGRGYSHDGCRDDDRF